MDPLEINKVEIRNLQREDYDQLAASFTRVYADGSDVFWTPEQIDKLIRIFPEGQIVVVIDDKIVGCALSIIVHYDDVKNDHTYAHGKRNLRHPHPQRQYPLRYRGLHSSRLPGTAAGAAHV